MRPHYSTHGIVLARSPLSEASTLLHLLSSEFGLIRVRAQGVRKPGAKLSGATQTFARSTLSLVRGKEVWRLSGATDIELVGRTLSKSARERAGRVGSLILRLVHGETQDTLLYDIFNSFVIALSTLSVEEGDAAEVLAALRILHALGLDAGDIPGDSEAYGSETLLEIQKKRPSYITRINRGLSASGL